MKKVLVIGANSYIGKSFENYVKSNCENTPYNYDYVIDNLAVTTEYTSYDYKIQIKMISASDGTWKLEDFSLYDTVLLLSGIVHRKETKDMEELYDKINHRLAVAIANKAKENSVRQFIFMSTAAVYGDKATCITKETVPEPTTYYGKSKLAAEIDILKLQAEEFKVAIVRPPMVYGEGCKGNYVKLKKLAKMMPVFPKFHNKRSMIQIDTLCEYLVELINQEECGYYLPQDQDYVDTCELVVWLRNEMGKKTWLVGSFNPMIRLMMKKNSSLNKMFGDFYYEKNQ